MLPAPPDGGYGWVIVAASFYATFIVDGLGYSFGLLLPSLAESFGVSRGLASVAGSLQAGLYTLGGPIVSALINAYGARLIMILGALVSALGLLAAAISPSIGWLLIAYGVLSGLGFGLIYLPAIVQVGVYFERRRALAMGIAVSGSGAGTIVLAPLTVALLESFGWRGALMVQAGMALLCAIGGAVMRPFNHSIKAEASEEVKRMQPPPLPTLVEGKAMEAEDLQENHQESKHSTESLFSFFTTAEELDQTRVDKPLYRRDIFYSGSIQHLPEWAASAGDIRAYREENRRTYESAEEDMPCQSLPRPIRAVLWEMLGLRLLKEPIMQLLLISNTICMLGFYSPYVFLAEKAVMVAGVSRGKAALLLSVLGLSNTLGRIVFGWLADRRWVSALLIVNVSLGSAAGLTLALPLLASYETLMLYAALFGFFLAAFICLTSIVLVDFLGVDRLSNSFGILMLGRGVSCLLGAPLGALVFDSTGSVDGAFLYSGILFAAATGISALIHLLPAKFLPKKQDVI